MTSYNAFGIKHYRMSAFKGVSLTGIEIQSVAKLFKTSWFFTYYFCTNPTEKMEKYALMYDADVNMNAIKLYIKDVLQGLVPVEEVPVQELADQFQVSWFFMHYFVENPNGDIDDCLIARDAAMVNEIEECVDKNLEQEWVDALALKYNVSQDEIVAVWEACAEERRVLKLDEPVVQPLMSSAHESLPVSTSSLVTSKLLSEQVVTCEPSELAQGVNLRDRTGDSIPYSIMSSVPTVQPYEPQGAQLLTDAAHVSAQKAADARKEQVQEIFGDLSDLDKTKTSITKNKDTVPPQQALDTGASSDEDKPIAWRKKTLAKKTQRGLAPVRPVAVVAGAAQPLAPNLMLLASTSAEFTAVTTSATSAALQKRDEMDESDDDQPIVRRKNASSKVITKVASAPTLSVPAQQKPEQRRVVTDESDEDIPVRKQIVKSRTTTKMSTAPVRPPAVVEKKAVRSKSVIPAAITTSVTAEKTIAEKNASEYNDSDDDDDDYVPHDEDSADEDDKLFKDVWILEDVVADQEATDDVALEDAETDDTPKKKRASSKKRTTSLGRPSLTAEQRSMILELHKAGGMTQDAIAAAVRCNQSTVSYTIEHPELNEKLQALDEKNARQKEIILKHLRVNETRAAAGQEILTFKKIAELASAEFGQKVWPARVNQVRQEAGIEVKNKRGANQLPKETRDAITLKLRTAQALYDEGKFSQVPSLLQIATECGVNEKTVINMKDLLDLTFICKPGCKKKLDPAKRAKIEELLLKGTRLAEIKRLCRCGQETITQIRAFMQGQGKL